MSTREILTLQLGGYSNFVGAHFWNLQELSFDYTGTVKTEVNHDILYREGQTAKGETTYTPRLLIADLKGALRTLPESGGLQAEELNDIPWDNVEKIEEPAADKNEYLKDIDAQGPSTATKEYKLEDSVNTWTDYLYPRLHSRTVNVIKEYRQDDENVRYSTKTTFLFYTFITINSYLLFYSKASIFTILVNHCGNQIMAMPLRITFEDMSKSVTVCRDSRLTLTALMALEVSL